MSGVDLSGLDALEMDLSYGSLIDGKPVVDANIGKPLELPIADIDEDPDQPRKTFSEKMLKEMADSIQQTGVRSPVSVRPHPSKPGKWILNYGARRYRGSIRAGKTTIPAFIDDTHDSYDQVIENIQKEDLSPVDIARFIQKREAKGEKKGAIAKRLGKPASFISKHAALIDLPASLLLAHDQMRCRDLEALYLLATSYGDYPEQIDALCEGNRNEFEATGEKITQAVVRGFLEGLRSPVTPTSSTREAVAEASSDLDQVLDEAETEIQQPSPSADGDESQGPLSETVSSPRNVPTKPEQKKVGEAEKLKRAIVQVRHDDRPARLLLDRRAPVGLAWIKYDDDGAEIEIDIGTAQLVAVVEGA